MSLHTEDIAKARKANLVEYLLRNGYDLKLELKGNYRLPGYGGLIIKENFWHNFSEKTKGNSVDFLVKYLHMDFRTAVAELLGYCHTFYEKELTREVKRIKPTLELPEKGLNEKRIIAYLHKKRYIPFPLIMREIRSNRLYQDEKGNCVFRCLNDKKNATGAILRGTGDTRFTGVCPGHDTSIGWYVPARRETKKGIVFEAPIDALSYLVLNGIVDTHPHIMAMGGLHQESVFNFIKTYALEEIVIAVDNDNAGNEFCRELREKEEVSTIKINREIPILKDWNLDLKKSYGHDAHELDPELGHKI